MVRGETFIPFVLSLFSISLCWLSKSWFGWINLSWLVNLD